MSEHVYITETDKGGGIRPCIGPCEEITRCRDCVHMFEMMDGFECERLSGQYYACMPDGFCAWAERRKE